MADGSVGSCAGTSRVVMLIEVGMTNTGLTQELRQPSPCNLCVNVQSLRVLQPLSSTFREGLQTPWSLMSH